MIREMTEKDLEQVCNIYLDANPFTTKKVILGWTKRNLKLFPKYHLVIENNKRIVGAISGVLSTKKYLASIEDIAIKKGQRSKGLGGKIIFELLKRFKTDKVKTVKLWVHWKDARAIPFYYKNGFRVIDCETTKGMQDVPDGEDIIHLARNL